MRAVGYAVAVALGLAVGVICSMFFIWAMAGAYVGLRYVLPMPPEPSPNQGIALMLGLYVIWGLGVRITMKVPGEISFVDAFLTVLPLPSIVIMYMWMTSRFI